MANEFAADYIDVAARIAVAKETWPELSLRPLDPTEPFQIITPYGESGPTMLVYAAAAYRTPDDPSPGIGLAWEMLPGRTPYTKGSELMVAETSAWGRALAALGVATKKSIATKQEVEAAKSRSSFEYPSVGYRGQHDTGDQPATEKQLSTISTLHGRHLNWLFGQEWLDRLSLLVGRTITAETDLTKREASALIGLDADEWPHRKTAVL